MNHVIEVKNLVVTYRDEPVIHNINFAFEKGKLVGIVGPNGAGKSTMIKAILSLIPSNRGSVSFFGKPLNEVRQQIAYIPQRFDIDWHFPINVLDTVALGTYPKLGLFKRVGKHERAQALNALKRVGMQDYAYTQISELSGGQQQRVFLARVLVQDADILFLDEPFVGVDVASELAMMNILAQLKSEGKTIFVVHHNLEKVKEYFDDLIILNKEIIDLGPTESVFNDEVLARAYGDQLATQRGLAYGSH